ncbi:hypothetical protein [Pseudomonas brassicacearum]|uniref:hypothetical protein n=1 Tax=Pseudomonas brassicacearum TaxID=930166 RepID=UPI001D62BB8A|nr:hypothetical protein [Pseudomonas brassicacearum]CAH0284784.1 hypothetical protein SRABI06_04052 [Pseudomonas brassicacearum]
MDDKNNQPVMVRESIWTDVKKFGIVSVTGGNQLYRNGYQQLLVKVFVEVTDWLGYSTSLIQSEFDSIALINGITGVALIKDRNRGDVGVWKYTEQEDSRFRQLPPNGPVQGPVPSGEFVYTKDFYVTSSSDRPIDLQLRITRADGVTFHSDKLKNFGALALVPLPPATYRPEQYSVRRTSAPYTSRGDIEKVEVFNLELIIDQQRMEFVTDFSMSAHLRIGSSDSRYTGYYVVGYGNGRSMRTGARVYWDLPDALGRDRSGNRNVAWVLAYGKHGGRVWVRDPVSKTSFELRDMYGNFHQLHLELTDNPLTVRVY